MTNYEVYEVLRDFIKDNIAEYGEGISITEDNISIDYPDEDNMKKSEMFFIAPSYETVEELSVGSDLVTSHIALYILVKGRRSSLCIEKIYQLYEAFYQMLRNNQNLGGAVDSAAITDVDFYNSVEGFSSAKALEVTAEIRWAKIF